MRMTLADGRVFDTKAKKLVRNEAQEHTASEPSFVPVPKTSYRLEELPSDSRQMTVICAILGFKFIGVPDSEICYALNCSLDQLMSIQASEAFNKTQKMMIESFVNGQTKEARDIIVRNASAAANTLVDVMQRGGMKERLAASNSLLDRAGIGSENSVDSMNGGLVIKVVRDTKDTNIEIKVGG